MSSIKKYLPLQLYFTLRGRMVIVPAFALMMAFVAVFMIGSYYQYREMHTNLLVRYQSVSIEIGKGIENALLQNDLGLVEKILERYAALESIERITLMNDHHDVVLSVRAENDTIVKDYSADRIDVPIQPDHNFVKDELFEKFVFGSPVNYDGIKWWIAIEVSKAKIFLALGQFALIGLIMIISFLSLLNFIIIKLLKKPVNDIRSLAFYTKQLSQNYGLQSDVNSDIKEIKDLAVNFNLLSQTLFEHNEKLKIQNEQLKRFNQELQQTVESEVQKNREKDLILLKQSRMAALGEMISHIAHQWRQPLNTVALSIQNLALSDEFGTLKQGDVANAVETAMQQIHYLSNTISDFQQVLKPSSKIDSFYLSDSIESALSLTSATYKFAHIHLEVDFDRSFYSQTGSKENLTQVLIVLLNNAKDAFEVSENILNRHVIIRMEYDESAQTGKIILCDNAGGISAEIIEKVFDPYFTTKHEAIGTGLGLYIAKKIIHEDFSGILDVVSDEGKTCFTILLNGVVRKD